MNATTTAELVSVTEAAQLTDVIATELARLTNELRAALCETAAWACTMRDQAGLDLDPAAVVHQRAQFIRTAARLPTREVAA